MVKVNEYFLKLPGSYLFSEIARRVDVFSAEAPGTDFVRMGIGDVTRPLPEACIKAMHEAADEMGRAESFRGYGPEQGYLFLRELIAEHEYRARGVSIAPDEIFVSDGAKSDCGNIVDLFGQDNVVAVCDPVYPVYVDTNVMAGRAGELTEGGRWSKIVYMPCVKENGFVPALPETRADLIYLCFPNNPTGAVATREQLVRWVDYARENGSVLLYDAAYEAYITEEGIPHSIFEIPGAETCAIEFRSFSKNAGFTGTRCAYTVVPKALRPGGADLNAMWNRRQCTKFNGTSYVIQRAAAAIYTEEGKKQVRALVDFYLEIARIICEGLKKAGLEVYGGVNSPYIWLAAPEGVGSWEFFDRLLKTAHVICTPGAGFGPSGEGYVRLTAFGGRESTEEGVRRIVAAL